MGKKDKFVLVNLREAKDLAKVISNDTSRKILDYLSEKDGSESEISRILGIPISTVHYNIKQLVRVGLVKVEEFEYSEKGREVNFYKLAKKMIIIAPDDVKVFKKDIAKILPVGLIGVIVGGLMYWFSKVTIKAVPVEEEIASIGFTEGARDVVIQTGNFNYLWFIYGVLFYMLLFILYSYVYHKITLR